VKAASGEKSLEVCIGQKADTRSGGSDKAGCCGAFLLKKYAARGGNDCAKKCQHHNERYKLGIAIVDGYSSARRNRSLAEDVLASHGRVMGDVTDG
jgi:hypothetical protein